MNVRELSDKALRRALLDYGESPGPVTGTTRDLYEKLLQSHLDGRRGPPSSLPRNNSPSRKARRQTIDTTSLRRPEKPNPELRRRTELVKPIFLADNVSLSDLSDSELPPMDAHGCHGYTPECESPPKTLSFASSSPAPAKAASRAPIRSKKPFTEQQKPASTWCSAVSLGALCMVVVAISIPSYYFANPKAPVNETVAQECIMHADTIGLTPIKCSAIFQRLSKRKEEVDAYSGRVICGEEGEEEGLYIPAPRDADEKAVLFHLRDSLNYSIFRRQGDVFLEVGGKTELEEFNVTMEKYFYKTRTPYISWVCATKTVVNNFAYYILIIMLVLVMAQLAQKVIEWKRSKAKQETGQMYELIDQIIEELQRNYAKYQADPKNHVPYVPIPHARDRLLLPSERSQMKHIWDKAVQFIAEHESRVRVEMRRVQSEDYPVWYWLEAAATPSTSSLSRPTPSDFLYPDLDADLTESCGATKS